MRSQVETINQKTQEISNLTAQLANCRSPSKASMETTISTSSESETGDQTTQIGKGGETQGTQEEGGKEGGHEDSPLDPLDDTQPETAFETSVTTSQGIDKSSKIKAEQANDLEGTHTMEKS